MVRLQIVQTARAKLHATTRKEIEQEVAKLQSQPNTKGDVAEHRRKKMLARLQAVLKQQEGAVPRRPRTDTAWSRSPRTHTHQQQYRQRAWQEQRESNAASAGVSPKRASSQALMRNAPEDLGLAVRRRTRQLASRQAELLQWNRNCRGAALPNVLPWPPQQRPGMAIPPPPRPNMAKQLQERTVFVELELAIDLPTDDATRHEIETSFRAEVASALEVDTEQVAQVTVCTRAHRLCSCRLCS